MAIVGIDHVQLAMPAAREEDARAFYSSLLGLPEVRKPEDLAKRGGVWFESSEVKIHLGVDRDFRPANKSLPECSQLRRDPLAAIIPSAFRAGAWGFVWS